VSVSNDGKCLLASCLDSKVRLLETDTGELLNAYSGHEATCMRAEGRLSHDDACVLSTSEDGRVVAWDIVQAVMVRQFKVKPACFAVPPHLIPVLCVLTASAS
jgi:mitogen-activated protein kinase organizer 1